MKRRKACPYGPTNDYMLSSPIGLLVVKSCPHGLHELHQAEDITDKTFAPNGRTEVKLLSQEFEDNGYTYGPVVSCVSWLGNYFRDSSAVRGQQTPPVCEATCFPKGSFSGTVWRTLLENAEPGTTLTYGQLAKLCGNPKASRAVGSALRRNPLQLVVPCHRVVCSDGSQGHYCGGARNLVKHWLLEHEGWSPVPH